MLYAPALPVSVVVPFIVMSPVHSSFEVGLVTLIVGPVLSTLNVYDWFPVRPALS